MCETAAYQLAPLFHTQHYVPFVRWNDQPFLKTMGDYCEYLLYNIVFMNSVLRMFVHETMLNGEVPNGDQGCRRGFRKRRFHF